MVETWGKSRMKKQITEQLKLRFTALSQLVRFLRTRLHCLKHSAKCFLSRPICSIRGCTYGSSCFDNFSLSCCLRCGRDVAGRTFGDILPVPDDYDFFEDLH